MKKNILLSILVTACILFLQDKAYSQISGTKTIPGDYANIAAAIAALNGNGVGPGGVTFNIAAGYTETITATLSLLVSGTSTKPLIFRKSGIGANPKITAYTGGTATPLSAIQDGIWQFVGSDYVTIDGIDLYDPNTTNPATMEYGYGMFKMSATNGCQYNTIKNCVITLSRNNNADATAPAMPGSRAINVMNSLASTQTTELTLTSSAGTNSYNKFYHNTLQNCNYGIAINGYVPTSYPYLIIDNGNDIGGNADSTGNIIINFGGATGAANSCAGIYVENQWGINMSHNTINNNNGSGVNHSTDINGIYGEDGYEASATISFNKITLHGGNLMGIYSSIGLFGSDNTNIIYITNNKITGEILIDDGSFDCIYNAADPNTLNINNNTISGILASGGASIYCIESSGETSIFNCLNNNIDSITSNQSNPPSYNYTYCIRNYNTSSSSTVFNCVNNYINHITQGNSCTLAGIYNFRTTTANIHDNSVKNLSCTITGNTSSDVIYGLFSTSTNNIIKNNILSNFSHAGYANITGIYSGSSTYRPIKNNQIYSYSTAFGGNLYGIDLGGNSADSVGANTIYNLNSTGGTTGSTYGIHIQNSNSSGEIIYNNMIHNLSNETADVCGIYGLGSLFCAYLIYNNKIYDLSTNASGAGNIYGISINNNQSYGYSSTLYNNKIYNLSSLRNNMHLSGIYLSGNHYVYNNIMGNFNTPNANLDNSLFGFYINSGLNYIYYNTVYLNANSSGTLFGSSAIYAKTSSTLYLSNNILVNTSVPQGAGLTTAYRRSSVDLSTYGNSSNNNFLYAGTPGPNNLIYYDSTVAVQSLYLFQVTVDPRDNASKTSTTIPAFLSTTGSDPTYLHIDGIVPSVLESGGRIIATYNNDFDGDLRAGSTGYPAQLHAGGTKPDIGADEFDGWPIIYASITENQSENITIYPNPATNTLYLDGLSNITTAEVYDISGKLLLTKQLNTNQIDISSLAKGLYFIKLTTEEGSVVRKFVKE